MQRFLIVAAALALSFWSFGTAEAKLLGHHGGGGGGGAHHGGIVKKMTNNGLGKPHTGQKLIKMHKLIHH